MGQNHVNSPNQDETLALEKRYLEDAIAYLPKFQEDLAAWFTIDDRNRGRWHGCRFIPYMDDHFNEHRHWVARGAGVLGFSIRSTTDMYMFAAAVCSMLLLMQTVRKVKGEGAMYGMMSQKDWPICSCGLGGSFLHPLQMLNEARLLPEEGTSAGYRKMYLKDLAVLRKLMSNGLEGYLDADVCRELDVQVERIHAWLSCAEGATKAERKYPKEYPPLIFNASEA